VTAARWIRAGLSPGVYSTARITRGEISIASILPIRSSFLLSLYRR
jgi:hypothetical protein